MAHLTPPGVKLGTNAPLGVTLGATACQGAGRPYAAPPGGPPADPTLLSMYEAEALRTSS